MNRNRHLYSSIGLALGFIALCVAALDAHAFANEPPPPEKRGRLEIGAGNRTLTLKFGKDEPPAPTPTPPRPGRIASIVLGLGAMGLGTLSWIRREHIRMSGGASALGLLAVAWPWVLIGVCIAIVIFILANLFA